MNNSTIFGVLFQCVSCKGNSIGERFKKTCAILEESTVTSVLILFVKINAFTWPEV